MTDAERLDSGHIRVPVRLEGDGVIGDGVVELKPGDPDYAEWDAFLNGDEEAKAADLDKWEAKALKRLKLKGRADAPFESAAIDPEAHARIHAALKAAQSVEAVKAAFVVDDDDTIDQEAREWARKVLETEKPAD
jgi:hypothetical protein